MTNESMSYVKSSNRYFNDDVMQSQSGLRSIVLYANSMENASTGFKRVK